MHTADRKKIHDLRVGDLLIDRADLLSPSAVRIIVKIVPGPENYSTIYMFADNRAISRTHDDNSPLAKRWRVIPLWAQ